MFRWIILFAFLLAHPLYANDQLEDNYEVQPELELEDTIEKGLEANELPSQTHLDTEPTAIVNQSVNVISGLYMDSEADLVVPGAEPMALQRSYISADTDKRGPLGKGWCRNYFGLMKRWVDGEWKNRYRAAVMESFGTTYHYNCKKKYRYEIDPATFHKSVTNSGQGMLSAHTNAKNNVLTYVKNSKKGIYRRGSGEKMIFHPVGDEKWWKLMDHFLPNGNSLFYNYGLDGELRFVDARNAQGNTLARLEFSSNIDETKKKTIEVKGSNGQCAKYHLELFSGKTSKKDYYIVAAERSNGPTIKYRYETGLDRANIVKVKRKSLPDNRFQEIEYYRYKDNYVGNTYVKIPKKKDPRVDRVMLQKAPVGTDATPIITHRYFYDVDSFKPHGIKIRQLGEGKATVLDAYDHRTNYRWNKNQRLTSISHYSGSKTGKYQLYSKDKMFWGEPEDCDHEGHRECDCSHLLWRCCQDCKGKILFARAFEYDQRGNVLSDKLIGNLSGECQSSCRVKNGQLITNDCEEYVKTYTYSNDGFNLVTSCTEGFNRELFTYKRGSNLLTKKLYTRKGKIYRREFYAYDNNAVMVKQIVDDGSSESCGDLAGVTERHIKTITVRQEFPIGLPEVVKEKYLDCTSGNEKLLRKTVNSYDAEGHLTRQELYDCHNVFAYALTWEYDRRGNVTKETDALGRVTKRRFDANGNMIYEKTPQCDGYCLYTYDFSNRLIKTEEVYDDGVTLVQTYQYNYLGLKVSNCDAYGQKTKFFYDDFGRLIKTVYPAVPDAQGNKVAATEVKEYGVLGSLERIIDAKGGVSLAEHNIRGKPTMTTHPDGTQEHWVYRLNGSIKKHTAKNGNFTLYTYDGSKRPTSAATYASSGELLTKTLTAYNTFHHVSEIDNLGMKKRYYYDGAGRLTKERKGKSCTNYEYDSLGRLCKTVARDGRGGGVAKTQKFDMLDRVLEESCESLDGMVLSMIEYAYDKRGNRISCTKHTANGPATSYVEYDARNVPICETDAEGNVTMTVVDHDYRNKHGQHVAYTKTIDPLGNSTITIKDVCGKIATVIRKNVIGVTLQEKNIFYDINGNKVQQVDKVIADGTVLREQLTIWAYNSMNEVTQVTEAFGAPEQKQTSIVYNKYGQKHKIVKPDGVVIRHKYDNLGRLIAYYASNRSFHYTYTYDGNDNILSSTDMLSGQQTLMAYNCDGHLIEEHLANGHHLKYSYDALERPLKVTLQDGSSIKYTYEGHRLVEVRRISAQKKTLYAHRYTEYGLDDSLLSAELIGNAGRASFAADLSGRATSIIYDRWREEEITYDSLGNMVARTVTDPIGHLPCEYRYDPLYQLTAEDGHATHSYSSDSLYNCIAKDGNARKVNGLNQLLSEGGSTYRYDANGNMVFKSDGSTKMDLKYDALNRLIYVKQKGSKVRYSYDSLNRRLSKQIEAKDPVSGKWEVQESFTYLYAGQNEIGCYNAGGELVELRILGTGKGAEIGAAVAIEMQGKIYAPLHDHIGNVVALAEAETGELAEVYRYSAFGESFLFSGESAELEKARNPWRYASKRTDPETGFVYFGRRYYDPGSNRWITPDPIGFQGGPNLYAYVLNSPMTHFDLYGLFARNGNGGYSTFGSALSYAFTSFANGLRNAVHFGMHAMAAATYLPGRIIENAALHLVPIPVVRDVGQIAGRILSNKRMDDFEWSFKPSSCYGDLGLPNHPTKALVLSNGMCADKAELIERAVKESQNWGGYNVYYYYNATHGFVLDLLESACQKVGIPTATERTCLKCYNKVFSDYNIRKDSDCAGTDFRLYAWAHSQAGQILDNVGKYISQTKRSLMDVCTFGSARLIRKEAFDRVRNFVSTRDAVSFAASPLDHIDARLHPREEVIYEASQQMPLVDHFWDSPTYEAVRARLWDEM